MRHLEWFFEKMAESRPPLFFNFRGGLLSSIFAKNHSKSLKTGIQKSRNAKFDLRHSEWFLAKMEESRPPLKLKNNGGLLSAIFSKNHSKCLKLTLENSQKSGFYSSEHVSLTIVKGAMRFRESPMVIIYPK